MPEKTLSEVFTDIADAIREKTGEQETMTPLEMAENIAAIPAGPEEDGIYNCDNGVLEKIYDASFQAEHAYFIDATGEYSEEPFASVDWERPVLYRDTSGFVSCDSGTLIACTGDNYSDYEMTTDLSLSTPALYEFDPDNEYNKLSHAVDVDELYGVTKEGQLIYYDADAEGWDRKAVADESNRSVAELFANSVLMYSSGTSIYALGEGFWYVNSSGQADFPSIDVTTGHAYIAATATLTAMSDGTYTISDGIPSPYVPPAPSYSYEGVNEFLDVEAWEIYTYKSDGENSPIISHLNPNGAVYAIDSGGTAYEINFPAEAGNYYVDPEDYSFEPAAIPELPDHSGVYLYAEDLDPAFVEQNVIEQECYQYRGASGLVSLDSGVYVSEDQHTIPVYPDEGEFDPNSSYRLHKNDDTWSLELMYADHFIDGNGASFPLIEGLSVADEGLSDLLYNAGCGLDNVWIESGFGYIFANPQGGNHYVQGESFAFPEHVGDSCEIRFNYDTYKLIRIE